MKVRTKEDVKQLDLRIKNELGVDLDKYKNQEVIDNFTSLLLFPKYVVNWGIRPILIAFILFILGFFLIDINGIEYVFYIAMGFGLFMTCGLLAGLLLVVWKMKWDMMEVMDYSMDILKLSVEDIDQVKQQVTPENRFQVLTLLFQGITHVVTIPAITEGVGNQVPVIGGFLKGAIKKILTRFSDVFEFKDFKVVSNDYAFEKDEKKLLSTMIDSIDASNDFIEGFLNGAFRIIRMPLTIVFLLVGGLLSLLIYMIW